MKSIELVSFAITMKVRIGVSPRHLLISKLENWESERHDWKWERRTKECSLFPVGDTAHCLKKPTEVDRRSSSRNGGKKGRGGDHRYNYSKARGGFFDKGRPLYSFYTRGDLQTLFFASFPPWWLYSWRERDHLSDGIKKTRHRDDSKTGLLHGWVSCFVFFFFFLLFFLISILWARHN